MRYKRRRETHGGGRAFEVGDRVLVTGGYDDDTYWLARSEGHEGTIVELSSGWAVVELDQELVLDQANERAPWQDFGVGSAAAVGGLATARGRWVALAHGWRGQQWREPIARLQVGLCRERPNLGRIPARGGIGAWIESHATMKHLESG